MIEFHIEQTANGWILTFDPDITAREKYVFKTIEEVLAKIDALRKKARRQP